MSENRKSLYSKKGSYAGYDKKNKEREALDYYSTPIEEVTNILNILDDMDLLDVSFEEITSILEPCCGGLHMCKGIQDFFNDKGYESLILASDIKERKSCIEGINAWYGKEFDFLSDTYPFATENIDYIIMNPPYSVIEPFTMKALSIANKGVLMLGRLQFLEAEGRYEKIFSQCPPTDVFVYVDRICCYKNGNTLLTKPASVQAYAWFFWDFTQNRDGTQVHWIRRADKQKAKS